MSKYEPLWKYVKGTDRPSLELSFDEIEGIIGIPIDHSFLNYKKELKDYGYQVENISLKNKKVLFSKL